MKIIFRSDRSTRLRLARRRRLDLSADAERREAETGHTYRSAGRDTWPASLKDLRARFEERRTPKGARVQLPLFDDEDSPEGCRVCRL